MQKGLKNVAVVFGGMSCENEISVITGTMAANVMDRGRYVPYPVYLSQNGRLYTGKTLFDVASFRGGAEGRAEEALFRRRIRQTAAVTARKRRKERDWKLMCHAPSGR